MDGVGTAAAGDGVVAAVAEQAVIAVAAGDRIVAVAAMHGVVAARAVQRVAGRTAGDAVGARGAGAGEAAGADEDQVLDVATLGEREARQGGLDRVGAFAAILGDDVAQAVDHVGVVAGAAGHAVVAGAAVVIALARDRRAAVRVRPGLAQRRVAGDRIVAAEAIQQVGLRGA